MRWVRDNGGTTCHTNEMTDWWDVYDLNAEVTVRGRHPNTPLGVSVARRAANDATSRVRSQGGNSNNSLCTGWWHVGDAVVTSAVVGSIRRTGTRTACRRTCRRTFSRMRNIHEQHIHKQHNGTIRAVIGPWTNWLSFPWQITFLLFF